MCWSYMYSKRKIRSCIHHSRSPFAHKPPKRRKTRRGWPHFGCILNSLPSNNTQRIQHALLVITHVATFCCLTFPATQNAVPLPDLFCGTQYRYEPRDRDLFPRCANVLVMSAIKSNSSCTRRNARRWTTYRLLKRGDYRLGWMLLSINIWLIGRCSRILICIPIFDLFNLFRW